MTDEKDRSRLAYLQTLREYELEVVFRSLRKQNISPTNTSLLEIGAGTGAQAREMERVGFRVSAIDLAESNYADARVFTVIDYDGHHIPFPDQHFNVVFSSNVLEHIPHIAEFQKEIRRVLKDDGTAVHVLPSVAWRFWTTLSYYPHALGVLARARVAYAAVERRWASADGAARWKRLARALLPPRHGESGNWLTELWYFSRIHWSRFFRATGWDLVSAEGSGLFYTGNSIAASFLTLRTRQVLSSVLGAATNVFVLRKRSQQAQE
jgi:SAM-dependent methyltransferase